MIQNLPNYQFPVPIPQQPSYNAVKIDIHNPSVGTPYPQACPQNQVYAGQPVYGYPQNQVYSYPVASGQPYYPPVSVPCVPQPAIQPMQPMQPNCEPGVQQVNINQAPVAPQPVATQPNVEVQEPVVIKPAVDLNSFLARLSDPDYEVQAKAMSDLSTFVNERPLEATDLLDTRVVDRLIEILHKDSTKLVGPTQEQINARIKMEKNEASMTEDEKKLATTKTPMEQAELNKCYAMYTLAYLQRLFADATSKMTENNNPLTLTELPAAIETINQLKDNPNPMVRSSAVEALSFIERPEYKKDLTTLFTIAQNDIDEGVKNAATEALKKLDTI